MKLLINIKPTALPIYGVAIAVAKAHQEVRAPGVDVHESMSGSVMGGSPRIDVEYATRVAAVGMGGTAGMA